VSEPSPPDDSLGGDTELHADAKTRSVHSRLAEKNRDRVTTEDQ